MGMSMSISLAVAKASYVWICDPPAHPPEATWIYGHVLPCPADLGSRAFKIDGCGHKRLVRNLTPISKSKVEEENQLKACNTCYLQKRALGSFVY